MAGPRSVTGEKAFAENVGLRLQLIQAVLHNVSDADDAMQPSTLDDGEMADPLARHLRHHPRDRVIGLSGHGPAHHDVGGA